jgi:hypothetical protein
LIAASAADRAAIIFISLWGDIPRLQKKTRPPQFVRFCLLYVLCGCTALDKLKSTNEITVEATNRFSVITVVNWDEYQFYSEKQTNKKTKPLTVQQPSNNQQITIKQPQRKNDKKYTSYIKEEKKAAAPQEVFPPGIIPLHKFSLNHNRACAKIRARW